MLSSDDVATLHRIHSFLEESDYGNDDDFNRLGCVIHDLEGARQIPFTGGTYFQSEGEETVFARGGEVPDEIDLAFHALREECKENEADLEQNTVACMIAQCRLYAKTKGVDWKAAVKEGEEVFATW